MSPWKYQGLHDDGVVENLIAILPLLKGVGKEMVRGLRSDLKVRSCRCCISRVGDSRLENRFRRTDAKRSKGMGAVK